MATAEPDIEEVVRRVMARLGSAQSESPAGDGESTAAAVADELRVVGSVISAEHLTGRLRGVRRVTVSHGAVITPAARDMLNQQNIALARDGEAERGPGLGIVLATAETMFEPAALMRTLLQQGIAAEQLARCGLLAAVDELVDAVVRGGRLGVLLTVQTAAALCLANRTRSVRAALGSSVNSVGAARAAIGANLLVVDPAGRSLFELVGLVRACATGPTACPEPLRERLG